MKDYVRKYFVFQVDADDTEEELREGGGCVEDHRQAPPVPSRRLLSR
jgi:hypothetical protein